MGGEHPHGHRAHPGPQESTAKQPAATHMKAFLATFHMAFRLPSYINASDMPWGV